MVLFFIGILEMIIISSWTKVVSEAKVVASGIITVINVFIWYYVLQVVLNDVHNILPIIFYAIGCAIGTMMTTTYFSLKEKANQTSTPTLTRMVKMEGLDTNI